MAMKMCSTCGSIMLPKKEDGKLFFVCRNGHKETGESKITEVVKSTTREIAVVEGNFETLPLVKARCPQCKYEEAYNWEIQTRSPDEAATQFFRCKNCSHVWREYR
ncbi:MAG TPA: transcription factor S [Candidatus Nanoarchaeia archaeon]|nr:transcription factor S [Candidatus Nanoarchaeia archaeon]